MKTATFESQVLNSQHMLYGRALILFKNEETAKDFVQETMVKALTYRAKFREGTNLQGWLYTILKNLFINHYHSGANQKRNSYTDHFEDHVVMQASHITDNRGPGDLRMNEIASAIDRVDERFTKPFMLHTEGFKYEEISEQLNLPLGTVKTRIHKARKLIQQELNYQR